MNVNVTTANKGNILTKSGFRNYDLCINPYVGCAFGCKYCYVRFFVKDKEHQWGEFVRTRDHITNRLPKDLQKMGENQRIVIGTMTDPYQPIEREKRLTRSTLQAILQSGVKPAKVGIFTRSPIILEDLNLIKCMPKARIHYTITPYSDEDLKKIEPIPIPYRRRFEVVRKIKESGIRIHVNVSPILPVLSDEFTEEFAKELSDIGVDEFFVDPMQAYGEAYTAVAEAMQGDERWPKISTTILCGYQKWKDEIRDRWFKAWKSVENPNTLATWLDHQKHIAMNMSTGEFLDWKHYGEDAQP